MTQDFRFRAWRRFRSVPISAQIGGIVIAVYIGAALLAPWLAPYGESAVVGDQYELASDEHVLGTDALGRDMYTRLIYGARNTVGVALAATILAFVIGGGAGICAAALGGLVDHALARVVDVLIAIPILIFALLLLSVFGTAIPILVMVIAVLESTRVFRVARAAGMNVAVMEYVEVARLRGERLFWIVTREILPNIKSPLIAEFGVRFCFVFLLISTLSFLGLGIQPPAADWGSMVRNNASLITYGDITPLLPAGAIALLTVGVNFLVDWFLNQSGETRG